MSATLPKPKKGWAVDDALRGVNRLCLGTVRLGVPAYGFASTPATHPVDIPSFLAQAEAAGIHRFDTSPRYGESEIRLGAYLKDRLHPPPFISSKIDQLTVGQSDTPARMEASVRTSLSRLHVSRLDVCYLHQNEREILADPWVHDGFRRLKALDLIGAAGVSVYHAEECAYALDSGLYAFIQVPVSVFDLGFYNRFVGQGAHAHVRFTARSLLLQGILANRDRISGEIRQAREIHAYLHALDGIAARWQMTTTEMALRFVFSLSHIDHFLIGTLSMRNLRKNLAWAGEGFPADAMGALVAMASQEKAWSNPRNW